MFVYLFLAFFMSRRSSPFLSWRESLHWPPSAFALLRRQRSRSEGRDLSLWPMGGCFLRVYTIVEPMQHFFRRSRFWLIAKCEKNACRTQTVRLQARTESNSDFFPSCRSSQDRFPTHHCSLVNLSYRSTVSFIVTPYD